MTTAAGPRPFQTAVMQEEQTALLVSVTMNYYDIIYYNTLIGQYYLVQTTVLTLSLIHI